MGKRSTRYKNNGLIRFLVERGEEAYQREDYDESILLFDAAVEEMLQNYLKEQYDIDLREDLKSIMEELRRKKADEEDVQFVWRLSILRKRARSNLRWVTAKENCPGG